MALFYFSLLWWRSVCDHRMSPQLDGPVCIIDGSCGIYVPQIWAERYGTAATESANVTAEDVSILLAGPDQEFYWEAWEQVLNNYCHVVDNVKHFLWQDGDLFEYPETYEFEEQ